MAALDLEAAVEQRQPRLLNRKAAPCLDELLGCVLGERLPPAFARQLFALTGLGTMVTVTDAAPAEPAEALALAT